MDICISILLDPTNTEIPSIVSRVFVNQNLEDVLQSIQMKGAIAYLESKHIESVFEWVELSYFKEKNKYFGIELIEISNEKYQQKANERRKEKGR